jgi:prepilin signal peptidase PulO-like enzyme (type II secretory pathway)
MILKKSNGQLAVPFGPFLSAGALIFLFFIETFDPMMRWYVDALKSLFSPL